jgi:hypothetical protein
MIKSHLYQIIAGVFLLIFQVAVAENPPKDDFIYYETDSVRYQFGSPNGWRFDLENAQRDGYSAVILPDSAKYYDWDMIIYIWIYDFKATSYRTFISNDSLRFLSEHKSAKFARTDSVFHDSVHYSIYLETEDPGGKYEEAFIAYIKSGGEIFIYQMNISERYYYAEAQASFREALSRFEVFEALSHND